MSCILGVFNIFNKMRSYSVYYFVHILYFVFVMRGHRAKGSYEDPGSVPPPPLATCGVLLQLLTSHGSATQSIKLSN